MAAKDKNKNLSVKDIDKQVVDLKIELLKQVQKRKSIKRQIARLLTMKNQQLKDGNGKGKEGKGIVTKVSKSGGKKQSAN